MIINWKAIFVMGLVLSLIMGCQDQSGNSEGQADGDVQKIHITMIPKSAANPVFLSARTGAEAAANKLNDKFSRLEVSIDWQSPSMDDPEEQARLIRKAIQAGRDAIIVSCSDDSILTSAINEAVDSGVEVMTFDSDAPNSKRFAFYGAKGMEIGEKVMDELARVMGETGKVAILAGNENAPNLKQRVMGVQKAAEKYAGITIVAEGHHEENPQAAIAKMKSISEAHPDVDGWAVVGGWPFFDETLMNEMEPGKVHMVGIDALPVQLVYIEKGYADAFLGQPTFKWGEISVQTVVDKIYHQEEIPEILEMKPIKVWKDNLGGWTRQLRAWGYDDVPQDYLTL